MKRVKRSRSASHSSAITAIFALLFTACASDAATKGEPSKSSAQGIRTLDGRLLAPQQIDKTVESLMQANQVTGLGVSLIHDADLVYHKAYGLRGVAAKLPLRTDTVMDGASLIRLCDGLGRL